MVRSVLFFLLTVSVFSVNAQNKVASPTASLEKTSVIEPELLQFSEVEYDFGKIPQGRPVYHTFSFKNNGKVPVSITDVSASCGCTTPEWSRETIPAGGSASIRVGYNAADEGSFARPVFISFNNGDHSLQLIVKGEVWKTPVRSAPENHIVNKLNKNQSL